MNLFGLCEIFYKKASIDKEAANDPEYMKNYMRNRYHNIRNQIINELGGKCVSCGSKNDLELDHKDKSKKTMRMGDLHSVSDAKLKKEVENIQLLCHDCHKEKTHDAWDYGVNKPEHGTYWMYRKHECHCPKCVEAYRAKNKEWNDARK